MTNLQWIVINVGVLCATVNALGILSNCAP